jgi:hypothetical protein
MNPRRMSIHILLSFAFDLVSLTTWQPFGNVKPDVGRETDPQGDRARWDERDRTLLQETVSAPRKFEVGRAANHKPRGI